MNNEQKIEILERKLAEANREISIHLTSLKEQENIIEELNKRLGDYNKEGEINSGTGTFRKTS